MKFDLNKIRIATPCPAQWDQMKGDNRVRHCGECKLNVYNLAGLTQQEAQALLVKSAKGERVCMRLARRKDGTVITSDCPVGLRIVRNMKLKIAAIGVPLISAFFWLAGVSRADEPQPTPEIMGKIAAPIRPTMGEAVLLPEGEEPLMGDIEVPPPPLFEEEEKGRQ